MGAVLDRNGLRPSRYYITDDDYLILSSEVGVLDIDPTKIVVKERLRCLLYTSRGMRLADGDALTAIHLLGEGESAQTEVKGKPVMLNRLHVAGRDTKGTKK